MEFDRDWKHRANLPNYITEMINAMPTTMTPMTQLTTVLSVLQNEVSTVLASITSTVSSSYLVMEVTYVCLFLYGFKKVCSYVCFQWQLSLQSIASVEDRPSAPDPCLSLFCCVLYVFDDRYLQSWLARTPDNVSESNHWEYVYEDCVDIIARLPTVAALIYRNKFQKGSCDQLKKWNYQSKWMKKMTEIEIIVCMCIKAVKML
jgi:hypothetical protein